MNVEFIKKISLAKNLLREDSSSLTFGIIEDGITEDMLSQNKELFTDSDKKIGQYIDFMKEVSGFSLGSIVLFDFCHIRDFQYLLDFIPDWKSKWLCIGKIMSEPIGINKEDGNVYWFSEIPYNDEGMNLGEFIPFMEKYVFGHKYSEIIPWVDEDEWYQFMIRNRLIYEGDING